MVKAIHKPGTGLFPVPAVMVSCVDEQGEHPNIITIAWVGTLCSDPPMVGISIRPQRLSHELISASSEFVVNIPSTDQLFALDYCGVHSGRDGDKFAASGLTQEKGHFVKAPLIKECPVALECSVQQILKLGSHDLFMAEIVAIHIEESILDEKGKIDYKKAKPLVYNPKEYWDLNRPLGVHGLSKAK